MNECLSRMQKGIHLGLNSKSKIFQAFLKITTLKVEHMAISHTTSFQPYFFYHSFDKIKPALSLTSWCCSTLKMVADFFFSGEGLPLVLARVQIHLCFL